MSMVDEIREQPSVFTAALKANAEAAGSIADSVQPEEFRYALIAAHRITLLATPSTSGRLTTS